MRIAALLAALSLPVLGCAVTADDADEVAGASTDDALSLAKSGLGFAVDVDENGRAVSNGIPIAASEADAEKNFTTVYAVPLKGVPAGSELRVTGDLSVSKCIPPDTVKGGNANSRGHGDVGSPCEALVGKKTLYKYAPILQARVVLVDGATNKVLATLGNDLPRSANADDPAGPSFVIHDEDWTGYPCDTELHHCKVLLRGTMKMPAGTDVRLELHAAAWSRDPSRHGYDVMELEADCANGNDYHRCSPLPASPSGGSLDQKEKTAGLLGVTVVAPGAEVVRYASKAGLVQPKMQIPIDTAGDRTPSGENARKYETVLFAMPVKGFAAGDVLEARAVFGLRDDPKDKPYVFDHFTSARIMLTSLPTDTKPTGKGARWLSSYDGKNCPAQGCEKEAIGATQIGGDAPAGEAMYVVVTGSAIEQGSGTKNVKGANVDVTKTASGDAPFLEVTCRSLASGTRAPCAVGL